jgi:hypothetical protein
VPLGEEVELVGADDEYDAQDKVDADVQGVHACRDGRRTPRLEAGETPIALRQTFLGAR